MPNVNEDSFVNIWFGDEPSGDDEQPKGTFTEQWMYQSSARHSYPPTAAYDALRKLYPKHSIVMTGDYQLNNTLLSFPDAIAVPMERTPLMTSVFFALLPHRNGGGVLAEEVDYGAFRISWSKYDFMTFHITFLTSFGRLYYTFVLHAGPQEPTRSLLIAAGVWQNKLHDEVWVFNQGFWRKDHALWLDIQQGNWNDVILKEKFKTALKKDVYGFFDSEDIYKRLGIPWKRGLIMYGPPGNGKTISLKVVIKTCSDKGFNPLYVKSFQSYKGEEGAMQDVFNKAREVSPCVLIMEDLDSLITDRNRSFFLNQLDGLVGNDGLLVIGTTNHFEKLDPALSGRPSRFDRKYLFDDPDREERVLYAQYWQTKLKENDDIVYPDSLVYDIADHTDGFSFAYLKEAFVSSLVLLAGEKDKPSFESVVMEQIKILQDALDKLPKDTFSPAIMDIQTPPHAMPVLHSAEPEADGLLDLVHRKFAGLSTYLPEQRHYITAPGLSKPTSPSDSWAAQPTQLSPTFLPWKKDSPADQPTVTGVNSKSNVIPSTTASRKTVNSSHVSTMAKPINNVYEMFLGGSSSSAGNPGVVSSLASPAAERSKTSFSWYRPEMHGGR